MQLQHAFIVVQNPDSGEGRVEVTNDSLRAFVQDIRQVGWLGKGNAHVSPNTSLTYLRILGPFSILDVKSSHIPSIDFSLLIEQRVVPDQEPAICAVLTQHTLLSFERRGSEKRSAAFLTQPLYILRVEKTSTIVLFLHIFKRGPVVIQHSLIYVQH